jgi:large subunit ribosomal protein L25
MAKQKIKVEKRKVFGRKVKNLRQEGILPANIYGKKIKSKAVKLDLTDFYPVFRKVGETGLVDLNVKGEKTKRTVLIHNVQFDPVTDQAIHVDFHQVDLKEKIEADIPVEMVGESPADEQKKGILVQLLNELEVEALPADLPEKIEVEISSLKEVDDMIKVADLKVDKKKVEILTDASRIVAKIEPLAKIEEEKPAKEEVLAEEGVPGEEEAPAEKKPEEVPEKSVKETPKAPEKGKPQAEGEDKKEKK